MNGDVAMPNKLVLEQAMKCALEHVACNTDEPIATDMMRLAAALDSEQSSQAAKTEICTRIIVLLSGGGWIVMPVVALGDPMTRPLATSP